MQNINIVQGIEGPTGPQDPQVLVSDNGLYKAKLFKYDSDKVGYFEP